jgi:hypothetical protein
MLHPIEKRQTILWPKEKRQTMLWPIEKRVLISLSCLNVHVTCQIYQIIQDFTLFMRAWVAQWVVGLPNNSYKPITNMAWVRAWLCKLQKRCTRLATSSDKVNQLLVHDRWFWSNTELTNEEHTTSYCFCANSGKGK